MFEKRRVLLRSTGTFEIIRENNKNLNTMEKWLLKDGENLSQFSNWLLDRVGFSKKGAVILDDREVTQDLYLGKLLTNEGIKYHIRRVINGLNSS